MKTKLIPFDIEKAKNGAKIVTRSGLSAKRVDVDVNNGHPVLCLVTWKDGIETPILYSIDGRYYPDQTDDRDLFIEEREVEETDDYDPYKATVESIADMVERYSELQSLEELKDFYNNVRIKCRDAFDYGKVHMINLDKEINPDKWYTCIESWSTIDMKIGDWFEEGHYYLGSDILKYKGLLEDDEDFKDYFHPWNISDAKDGDVLVCIGKYGQEIGIVKKYVGKYDGDGCEKCFEPYCFIDWDGIFRLSEYYMGSKEFYPATKEQRDLLFQKMKEVGYQWDSERKELKKIKYKDDMAEKEVKQKSSFNEFGFRRMTNQELSWWLHDHPEEHRECRFETASFECEIFTDYPYLDSAKDCEVPDKYYIRKNGREWQEPLVEI